MGGGYGTAEVLFLSGPAIHIPATRLDRVGEVENGNGGRHGQLLTEGKGGGDGVAVSNEEGGALERRGAMWWRRRRWQDEDGGASDCTMMQIRLICKGNSAA